MSSNGWSNIYRDQHVLVRVGNNGEVGVWYGNTGSWEAWNVSPNREPIKGVGATMHEARADIKSQE